MNKAYLMFVKHGIWKEKTKHVTNIHIIYLILVRKLNPFHKQWTEMQRILISTLHNILFSMHLTSGTVLEVPI